MLRILCTVAIVAALQVSPEVQSGRPTVITGRVSAGDTGDPLQNARLFVRSPAGPSAAISVSGSDGRFALPVAAIPTTLTCIKTGYGSRELLVTNAQVADIQLTPAAVISGRVVDETGDPVMGATVA